MLDYLSSWCCSKTDTLKLTLSKIKAMKLLWEQNNSVMIVNIYSWYILINNGVNLPMMKGAGSLVINIMASNKLTFTAHAGQIDWINKILSCH